MTFVIISGAMADLSVPASIVLAMLVLLSSEKHIGVYGGVLLAVAASATVGLINGLLIGYLRANSIIVTLGVNIIALGLAQQVVRGRIIYGTSNSLARFVSGKVIGVPVTVWLFVIVALAGHVLLDRTRYGRKTFAVGGNYATAVASALSARWIRSRAFILTAALAGVAGCGLALTLGVARPEYGNSYQFSTVTAVVVGGTSLFGGRGSIPRTVGGLLLVGMVSNIMSLHGAPASQQGLPLGILIILAVGLDGLLRRRSGRA
jgi:ribose transport system permease protein